MAITYRAARIPDIEAVSGVYRESIRDVYTRHGFEGRTSSFAVNPFYGFCLSEEPGGFFVAEDAGKVIGAAFSWVRGRLWFLSHLFVLPRYHGMGTGRVLMELSRRHGRTAGTKLQAVITMAFNPASIALYMKAGMFPIQDIYLMKAPRESLAGQQLRVDHEKQGKNAWRGGDLDALDLDIMELARPAHHRFLLGLEEASCLVFRVGGRLVAYAYHFGDGRIGPVATVEDAPYEAILETVMAFAGRQSDSLTLMIPGSNTVALGTALSHGFTLVMPYVMLSSNPFGAWNRYLFHSPGIM